jgi:hypothetical protein
MGVRSADVAVQRQLELGGGGLGHGQRDAEDGVGAQAGLVVGAVQVEQQPVDVALLEGVEADQGVVDLAVDVADGLEHALAAVALVAVAQLDGLEGAGGGARGDDGSARGPRVEDDLDLDGGIAAGVEDLASDDVLDGAHGGGAPCSTESVAAEPGPWRDGDGRTRQSRAPPARLSTRFLWPMTGSPPPPRRRLAR